MSELNEVFTHGGVMAKLVKDGHSPQTIESRLGIRASLGGHPTLVGQEVEFYLLGAPLEIGSALPPGHALEAVYL